MKNHSLINRIKTLEKTMHPELHVCEHEEDIKRRLSQWGGIPKDLKQDLDKLNSKFDELKKYHVGENPIWWMSFILDNPGYDDVLNRYALFLNTGYQTQEDYIKNIDNHPTIKSYLNR